MKYEMQYVLLQPWSTFVMKTRLPQEVFVKMLRISDEIVENKLDKDGVPTTKKRVGAGQVEDQFFIDLEILEREEILEYFSGVCTHYVELAFRQSNPFEQPPEVYACPNMMWINSQKDNEYFSMHAHVNSDVSASLYLKIPKYLPDRKSYDSFSPEDGAVTFTNNSSTDKTWARPEIYLQPEVGDFFLFPGGQQHFVYPFRTEDGKGERICVSFNAKFTKK